MPVRMLQPVAAPADSTVLDLLPMLAAALRGDGPALLLHQPDAVPHPALAAGGPLTGAEDDPDDPTVVVVATSGSTGTPKGVLLQASALLASASATHDRLGGPGHWVLALPVTHVAGLQVLVRSLVARRPPAVCDTSDAFSPEAFAAAVAATRQGRRYTALVPTQLLRLLDAGGAAAQALAALDAVLVGGAALPAALHERALTAGVAVVTTYGMSETAGGCVYDGVPLDGVRVRVDDDGRVHLGGPTVARGYRGLDDGSFRTDPDGTRWHRTQDAGAWDGDRLTVAGRLDDVVVTGGVNVSPRAVEEVLLAVPGVGDAAVVGVADPQWGQRVVAAVVPAPGCPAPVLADLRDRVRARLGGPAAPRQLVVLDALPLTGPGKPDRAALRRLAAG